MSVFIDFIKKYIGISGVVLFLAGLLFSPFILSISFFFIILQFIFDKSYTQLKQIRFNRISIYLLLFFAFCLLGGIYTSDINRYLHDIQLKLPFFLLPVLLMHERYYLHKNLILFLYTLNIFVFIAGFASFINYLINYDEINQLIFEAKPVPIVTKVNHIYYSFILAFSIFSGLFLHFGLLKNRILKFFNLVIIISCLIFIHSIAARTGLVAFYGAAFSILLLIGFRKKKHLQSVVAIVLIGLVGFFSVRYIPVLENRYLKSLEDVNAFLTGGDINHYSISMRLEYWEKSLKVFGKSPFIGVGNGDVSFEMKKVFESENSILEEVNRKGPHNEYLEIMAGLGIFGIILFLLILFDSFKVAYKEKDVLFTGFLLIMAITFLFESALERQVGISFFSLFLVLLSGRNIQKEEPTARN